MRKTNWKRAGALALATAMLATALALPASAAADQAYMDELADTDWGDGMLQLAQKYPNSPEPLALHARNKFVDWWNGHASFSASKAQQVIAELDQVLALGLQTDHPYQSRWEEDEMGSYPDANGYEKDYTTQAADEKATLQSWIPGQQEQVINSLQQYMDCWDRMTRINLRDVDQAAAADEQRYLSWDYTAAEAKQKAQENKKSAIVEYNLQLSQDIPALRAELDEIRAWYAAGDRSYDVGRKTRENGYLSVGAAKGDTVMLLTENPGDGNLRISSISFSKPIQQVQRTLNSTVIFVPKGTGVTVNPASTGIAVYHPNGMTATSDPQQVVYTTTNYNGDYYAVFVVGV